MSIPDDQRNEMIHALIPQPVANRDFGEPDPDASIVKAYRNGLSLMPPKLTNALNLDKVKFHRVIMKALLVCKRGWPNVRKEDVRKEIRDCEALEDLFDPWDGDNRDLVANQAIDFSLRMWLLLDCSDLGTEGTPTKWTDQTPLREFVKTWFSADDTDELDTIKKFPRKFIARHIEGIAGIKVRWTEFLSEHLIFNETTETLAIFKYGAWLGQLCDTPNINDRVQTSPLGNERNVAPGVENDIPPPGVEGNVAPRSIENQVAPVIENTVATGIEKDVASPGIERIVAPGVGEDVSPMCALPPDLLTETIWSIGVLFPAKDGLTGDRLAKEDIDFHLVRWPPGARARGSRQQPRLREFKFLRERLLDLIEEYQSPPRHWQNIWRDRRNPIAFWTFWIGLTIFFITLLAAVVASVLAGLTLGEDAGS